MERETGAECGSAEVLECASAPNRGNVAEAVTEPELHERQTATVAQMCNTRAEARLTSGITGWLGTGQKVEIVEESDGWAKVVTGWVKKDNLNV